LSLAAGSGELSAVKPANELAAATDRRAILMDL
jgi:hypothetical protein